MSDKYPGGFVTANAPAGFSVYTNGSGSGPYIRFGSSAALTFGTGDFTIEFWVNFLSINDGTINYLYDMRNANGTGSFFVGEPANTWTYRDGAGNLITTGMTSSTFTANQWYHVAVCRASGVINFYINGTKVSSNPTDTSNYATSYISIMSRHVDDGGANNTNAYTSNFRIVKGTALYTANFTPPTQLLAITNTSLLTCQSPTIVDNSSNALTPTIATTNAPTVSNFTPFAAYTGFNPALGAAAGGVWTLDEAAYYQNNRQWPIYDPYFKNTTLMLHGNGTNGAQNNTFLDSSTNNFTITRNGNTTQGTFTPFSQTGWSTYFNGSSYLTVTNAATQMAFGTGDWQIEMFLYPTSLPSTDNVPFDGRVSNGAYPVIIVKGTSASPSQKVVYYVNTSVAITSDATLPLNAWSHVMVSRVSGTTRMFINGVVQSGTYADSTTYLGGNSQPWIGANGGAAEFWNGYISNVRILKGSGTSASFTPSTTPLTAVTNTVVLTCQSNRFVDNSASNLTITAGSAPSVQAFSPFVPAYITPTTYSNWFDGTGDYLSMSSGTSLGAGNFTIECWVYLTAAPAGETTVGSSSDYYTAGFNGNFVFRVGTTNLWRSFDAQSNQATIDGTFTWSTGQWYHMAWVRNSGTVTVYRNGTSLGSVADSKTLSDSTNGYAIAATKSGGSYSSLLTGIISNFRVVVGTALYTAAFTPPTAPLTAISGTSLLTCQNSTFIDNSTNNFTITATGNTVPVASPTPFPAKVDTTTLNSAYSTSLIGGSAYFDGTGDYLTLPANAAFNFNTGDFTLETWIYMPSFSTFQEIFSQGSGNFQGIGIYTTTSGKVHLDLGNGSSWYANAETTNSLKLNSWNHVAVVRQSTTYTIYLNGASDATTTTATFPSDASGASSYIGVYGPLTSQLFTGYMSGYRLVKGTAVYTSNFAPPVAPPTAVTNTQLLTNFTNGAIFDNTAKNVLETVGNAQISTTQSKWGGSSMYFDGTGDWLFINSSSASSNTLALGGGDFTVELWLYPNATYSGTFAGILDSRTSGDGAGLVYFGYTGTANQIGWKDNTTNVVTGTVTQSAWNHVAISRAAGTMRMFINGIQVSSGSNSTNYTVAFKYIGSSFDPYSLNGYIDDLRITKGVARYTTNFTPPTSQLQDQ